MFLLKLNCWLSQLLQLFFIGSRGVVAYYDFFAKQRSCSSSDACHLTGSIYNPVLNISISNRWQNF